MKKYLYGVLLLFVDSVIEINGFCNKFDRLQLCDNVDECPTGYHTCNTFDMNILLDNEKYLQNIDKTYYTNIAYGGNNCETCNENELNSVITIEPYSSEDTAPNKDETNTCIINNRKLQYGEGVRINTCLTCVCSKDQTICVNMCDYGYLEETRETTVYEYRLDNCVGLRRTNIGRHTCKNRKEISNIACCRDNACYLEGCKSCMNYGEREECNECKSGYYTYKEFKTKCFDIDTINDVCSSHYKIDELKHSFDCLTCVNGAMVNLNNITQCVCHEGWYGEECEKSYSKTHCSSNGEYNIDAKECVCNEDYYGSRCEENILYSCMNGVYNSEAQRCVCDYGFSGTQCEREITCIYGTIYGESCVCNEGFSGDDCTIMMKPTQRYIDEMNQALLDFESQPCKNGVTKLDNEETICECFNGYIGADCGTSICNNGRYISQTDECICRDGWYGERCSMNCHQRCSYNGNVCNTQGICECNDGWSGTHCELFSLHNRDTIVISNTIEISVELNTADETEINIETLSIQTNDILPFKIKNVNTNESLNTNSRLLQSVSREFITLDVSQFVCGPDEVTEFYIFPDNNQNHSYYGGNSSINITLDSEFSEYYIYRQQDITSVENHLDDDSHNNTTETIIEQQNTINSHQTDETKYKNLLEYLLISFGIGLSIIIVIVIMCLVCKSNRRNNRRNNNEISISDSKEDNIHINNPMFLRNNADRLNTNMKAHRNTIYQNP